MRRAGSLWHKKAGVAIPRINPRHRGGPLWFQDSPVVTKIPSTNLFHAEKELQRRTGKYFSSQVGSSSSRRTRQSPWYRFHPHQVLQ